MTEPLPLASAFDAATRDDWLAEVRRVLLKGQPEATDEDFAQAFAQRLITRTGDGLQIQPLYTAEDAPSVDLAPGQAPFIRSTHATATPWEIRQRVWPALEDSRAVSELESGATGVLIDMTSGVRLADALEGVLLDLAPVSLSGATVDQAAELLNIWTSAGIDAELRRGSLGLDPLGDWARGGGGFDLDERMDALATLVMRAHDVAPQAQAVLIDGTVWHDAGATDAQESAWTIAAGLWVVRQLVARGVALTTAVRSVEFRFAATAEQFPTIAKLRAVRWLWARALEVAGVDEVDRAMRIHAESSRVMLTRYDIWVNILRSTVATFAAGVGGADAITVLPHDLLLTPGGSPLGRRIARNTQSILQLESHLSKVVDPAGGSWFVESLTRDLAQHGWSLVQQTERDGGIVSMLDSGIIHDALEESVTQRARAVATRKRPITGVSEFPNIEESSAGSQAMTDHGGETPFPPLVLRRASEGFEQQRLRADSADTRPTIYLVTLGSPAQSTARATFAKNFFETAGIRTIAGPLEGYVDSGTDVVCLCSTDSVYVEQAAAAVEELRNAGARRIFLAGRGAQVPGVDEEIGIGVDVLEVLTRTLDEMGVPR